MIANNRVNIIARVCRVRSPSSWWLQAANSPVLVGLLVHRRLMIRAIIRTSSAANAKQLYWVNRRPFLSHSSMQSSFAGLANKTISILTAAVTTTWLSCKNLAAGVECYYVGFCSSQQKPMWKVSKWVITLSYSATADKALKVGFVLFVKGDFMLVNDTGGREFEKLEDVDPPPPPKWPHVRLPTAVHPVHYDVFLHPFPSDLFFQGELEILNIHARTIGQMSGCQSFLGPCCIK